jgi:hypothetical protein
MARMVFGKVMFNPFPSYRTAAASLIHAPINNNIRIPANAFKERPTAVQNPFPPSAPGNGNHQG